MYTTKFKIEKNITCTTMKLKIFLGTLCIRMKNWNSNVGGTVP